MDDVFYHIARDMGINIGKINTVILTAYFPRNHECVCVCVLDSLFS